MRRLLAIELLKTATTRLSYGLLATATGLTLVLTVLRAATAGSGKEPALATASGFSRVLTVLGFDLLLATVFGLTISSGEFRHHTATTTYLAAPHRGRVLIAKLVAGFGGGLFFGAAGFAATCAVGFAFLRASHDSVPLSATTILRDAGGAILAAALLAAVGVALGTLVRSQLAAVIGVFIWGLFVESIMGGVYNTVGPYLPFTAATTLAGAKLGGGGFGFAGSSSTQPLPFLAAAAIVAAVGVAIATAATPTTLARDIT